MHLLKKIVTLILLLPVLASCSYEDMLDKFVPKEESEVAIGLLENLRQHNLGPLKAHLSSELLTPDIDQKLAEVASYFPAGEPKSIKVIGSNVTKSPDSWLANLTYQYEFDSGWAVANVVLAKENNKLIVKTLRVNRLAQSLQEMNAFTLSNKSLIHYLVLVLAVIIPLFILYALVLCIRTPMEQRKWLWIVFVIAGFVGFSLNWTSGQTALRLIHFQLLGAGAMAASPYAPWVITISIPLGQ